MIGSGLTSTDICGAVIVVNFAEMIVRAGLTTDFQTLRPVLEESELARFAGHNDPMTRGSSGLSGERHVLCRRLASRSGVGRGVEQGTAPGSHGLLGSPSGAGLSRAVVLLGSDEIAAQETVLPLTSTALPFGKRVLDDASEGLAATGSRRGAGPVTGSRTGFARICPPRSNRKGLTRGLLTESR